MGPLSISNFQLSLALCHDLYRDFKWNLNPDVLEQVITRLEYEYSLDKPVLVPFIFIRRYSGKKLLSKIVNKNHEMLYHIEPRRILSLPVIFYDYDSANSFNNTIDTWPWADDVITDLAIKDPDAFYANIDALKDILSKEKLKQLEEALSSTDNNKEQSRLITGLVKDLNGFKRERIIENIDKDWMRNLIINTYRKDKNRRQFVEEISQSLQLLKSILANPFPEPVQTMLFNDIIKDDPDLACEYAFEIEKFYPKFLPLFETGVLSLTNTCQKFYDLANYKFKYTNEKAKKEIRDNMLEEAEANYRCAFFAYYKYKDYSDQYLVKEIINTAGYRLCTEAPRSILNSDLSAYKDDKLIAPIRTCADIMNDRGLYSALNKQEWKDEISEVHKRLTIPLDGFFNILGAYPFRMFIKSGKYSPKNTISIAQAIYRKLSRENTAIEPQNIEQAVNEIDSELNKIKNREILGPATKLILVVQQNKSKRIKKILSAYTDSGGKEENVLFAKAGTDIKNNKEIFTEMVKWHTRQSAKLS